MDTIKTVVSHRHVEVMCGLDFDWKRLLLSFDEWVEGQNVINFTSCGISEIRGFEGTLKCIDDSELPKEVKPRDDLIVHHADGGFFGYLRVSEVDKDCKIAKVKNQGCWKLKMNTVEKVVYKVRACQKGIGKVLYERVLTDKESIDPVRRTAIANALLKVYPDCSCEIVPCGTYVKWESEQGLVS